MTFFIIQPTERRSANVSIWRLSTILTPNMQRHSDKVIKGKTPQLPIIAQVFGHVASKRRHCSAFELKKQVIKTFISLLEFSLNVGKV